jgi:type IV pilus assembly protein PilN
MTLDGVAQSNASVAEYMRNIETSPWMGQTDLHKTENSHDASRMPYTFGLNVALQRPKQSDAPDGSPPATSSTAAKPAQAIPVTGAKAADDKAAVAAKATSAAPPATAKTVTPASSTVKGGAK